tara:strand:- start:73 stop:285 length:213 start_codon:yes stop_codon:yes gene_type:complete
MRLSSEEIQLIEQAVKNEVYNLEKIAARAVDPGKAQEWIIRKRRLEIAMSELKRNYSSDTPLNNYPYQYR